MAAENTDHHESTSVTDPADDHSAEPTTTTSSGSGLDSNVAGALAYLFGFITGIIFFVVDKDDEFVRFHAAQSMVVSVFMFGIAMLTAIVSTIFSTLLFTGNTFFLWGILSLVFGLVWLGIGLVTFVVWLYMMFSAYQGKRVRIPVLAGFADRIA